ncbi:MAG TPA: Lrp/AsnC family transcriptional regulator [Candidatus Thermoplasmatota archaeon]|nr:Lrp/AsnC family transcriptional regulator [Candidatus Thermoplasmatota archaeon]
MADATPVPPQPLDEADRLLLRELLADGRASHRELAERAGLSLATVNRRVRRMEADGTIRGYTVLADAGRLGWGLTAVIGLRIDKGHVRAVHEEISADTRIFGVYDITGEWDGLVLVRLRDREDLDDLVKTTLSLPHIQRTNTMVVLKTVLERAVVGLPTLPPPAARPPRRPFSSPHAHP